MSWFRPSRDQRGPDPFLPHKMLLFAIGAGCGLAGIMSQRDWLVNVGIVVLFVGLILRIAANRRG